ncbi:MAG TPA: V-type ATP synthase subunit D [Candidatus Ratteibacteria bacterium]|nr:V-type ATP synthase subunit D [Candidatus Ratteibacteria bacterium]HRV04535.1 V-type ATP synthase subunit D [Candidatus Ratteibacteria bacterium]
MAIKIPATKTNLLKTKGILSLCKEGYQLLDEKRRILLMEISSITKVIDELQENVNISLSDAYAAVEEAFIAMGKSRVRNLAAGIDTEIEINITEKKMMGASIPSISLNLKENPPFCSPLGVHPAFDRADILLKEAIKHIAELAEKKIALQRLEKEFQRTTKKVNALEKIHIPYYNEVLKTITDRLDEESREAFSTLKEIKKKLALREF